VNFFKFPLEDAKYFRRSGTNLHVAGDVRSRAWKPHFTHTSDVLASPYLLSLQAAASQSSEITNWCVKINVKKKIRVQIIISGAN